ncbi:MAG: TIGR00296 family protein [Halobacteriota archaeon]|nr:TIGR00296 family protein [Halobacteriota archaeon]
MLNSEEGTYAVKLARNTIDRHIKGTKADLEGPPEKFKEERGVFVTLRKKGELRGCIGYPFPTSPLHSAIVDSAINAATRDPRFPPVGADELRDITVEVTVLTPPELIQAKPAELPKKIEIGRHGLIVNKSFRQGLLLPQVPIEQGWDEEDFLCGTCNKAGLPMDAWLEKDCEVRSFGGQIFEEVEPYGCIIEKKLE